MNLMLSEIEPEHKSEGISSNGTKIRTHIKDLIRKIAAIKNDTKAQI